jgi:hypothetical protein
MKKLGMLGIIGGAALLTERPFRCNGRKMRYLCLTALMPASIERSTAGHTAARLMQPDTAMAHITAMALRTIPATTRRSRTITGP